MLVSVDDAGVRCGLGNDAHLPAHSLLLSVSMCCPSLHIRQSPLMPEQGLTSVRLKATRTICYNRKSQNRVRLSGEFSHFKMLGNDCGK